MFYGEKNCQEIFKQFNKVTEINKYSNDEKLIVLFIVVRGTATTFLKNLIK